MSEIFLPDFSAISSTLRGSNNKYSNISFCKKSSNSGVLTFHFFDAHKLYSSKISLLSRTIFHSQDLISDKFHSKLALKASQGKVKIGLFIFFACLIVIKLQDFNFASTSNIQIQSAAIKGFLTGKLN
jgi:hypothetical protein